MINYKKLFHLSAINTILGIIFMALGGREWGMLTAQTGLILFWLALSVDK